MAGMMPDFLKGGFIEPIRHESGCLVCALSNPEVPVVATYRLVTRSAHGPITSSVGLPLCDKHAKDAVDDGATPPVD